MRRTTERSRRFMQITSKCQINKHINIINPRRTPNEGNRTSKHETKHCDVRRRTHKTPKTTFATMQIWFCTEWERIDDCCCNKVVKRRQHRLKSKKRSVYPCAVRTPHTTYYQLHTDFSILILFYFILMYSISIFSYIRHSDRTSLVRRSIIIIIILITRKRWAFIHGDHRSKQFYANWLTYYTYLLLHLNENNFSILN